MWGVGVIVSVGVWVSVAVNTGVEVGVLVAVSVTVGVKVGDNVTVAVGEGDWVAVGESGVAVGTAVAGVQPVMNPINTKRENSLQIIGFFKINMDLFISLRGCRMWSNWVWTGAISCYE